jgi:glyoxylase-like metal-dependent hydrolase (beta-lactamase superfamily II)
MADLVKAISDRVKPFNAGAQVMPGITSIALPGHTPGHVGYEIRSGKEKFIDIGDTVHSSVVSLEEPKWDVAFDGDHAQAEKTRLKILKQLAKSQEALFAPHFPFPGVGHIEADGDHFRWAPMLAAQ